MTPIKPLCIDLFCGLGGWAQGFLAEGYTVVGFDIEARPYPGHLVIQDVKTLHGSQFKDATVIVASPPCQEYSKYAMPFGALWREHSQMDDDGGPPINYIGKPCPNTYLFRWCFGIQREASEAAGHHIPMIIENVRGAQKFISRSDWNFGSFHLWGDIPALMPVRLRGESNKMPPEVNESIRNGRSPARWTNPAEHYFGPIPDDGTKIGGDWFSDPNSTCRKHGSRSNARKAASAQIAKIPLPLSQHIAQVYKPRILK